MAASNSTDKNQTNKQTKGNCTQEKSVLHVSLQKATQKVKKNTTHLLAW